MRILLGLILFFAFCGCDDGNLTVETINFDDVATRRCSNTSNILYKLTDSEALILEIANFNNSFLSDPTPAGTPITIDINQNNRVVYRAYNGEVDDDNICGTIPPATPTVSEEWNATSGTIEVTTTTLKTSNSDFPGGEIITGYRHSVIFRNITFQTPAGTQLYESFLFGNYDTMLSNQFFNFDNFDDELSKCSGSNTIYNFQGSEGLTLTVSDELLQNIVTPSGSPRSGLIGDENTLTYRVFSGLVTETYFCQEPAPTTPSVTDSWTANAGVEGMSGIIEVTTTTNSPGVFLHEIRLKNIIFKRGNSEFKLADDYFFGTLITN